MPTPQSKRVHRWQLAMGCCLVCGAPMELPGARLDDAAGASRDTPVGDADDETLEVISGSLFGRLACVKINKIKMSIGRRPRRTPYACVCLRTTCCL